MVVPALRRLGRKMNAGQALVLLALGFLLMLVVVSSAMRGGGEEYQGEVRTKTLIYESDENDKLGLYWIDDGSKLRKATPEEIERCKEMHPDEQIPLCRTTYYKQNDGER